MIYHGRALILFYLFPPSSSLGPNRLSSAACSPQQSVPSRRWSSSSISWRYNVIPYCFEIHNACRVEYLFFNKKIDSPLENILVKRIWDVAWFFDLSLFWIFGLFIWNWLSVIMPSTDWFCKPSLEWKLFHFFLRNR